MSSGGGSTGLHGMIRETTQKRFDFHLGKVTIEGPGILINPHVLKSGDPTNCEFSFGFALSHSKNGTLKERRTQTLAAWFGSLCQHLDEGSLFRGVLVLVCEVSGWFLSKANTGYLCTPPRIHGWHLKREASMHPMIWGPEIRLNTRL